VEKLDRVGEAGKLLAQPTPCTAFFNLLTATSRNTRIWRLRIRCGTTGSICRCMERRLLARRVLTREDAIEHAHISYVRLVGWVVLNWVLRSGCFVASPSCPWIPFPLSLLYCSFHNAMFLVSSPPHDLSTRGASAARPNWR
jgi:hypothetical protein